MALQAFFQRRSVGAAVTGPRPLLLYQPSTLSATNWQNDGTLGAGYNLTPNTRGTVTATAASGSDRPYIETFGGGLLATASDMPSILLGTKPRTLGFWVQQPADGSTNYIGYGTAGYGYLFDFMRYNGTILTPHYYGNQTTTPGDHYQLGQWNNVVMVYDSDGVNTPAIHTYLNGTLALATLNEALNTQASPLRIGGGSLDSYNGGTIVRIGGFWMTDGALAETQIADFNKLISY